MSATAQALPLEQQTVCSRVFLCANGNPTSAVLKYATEPSLDLFLSAAGEVIGIPARRCFARSGGEIEDVSLMMHNETLFISSGEDFLPCLAADGESKAAHSATPASICARPPCFFVIPMCTAQPSIWPGCASSC